MTDEDGMSPGDLQCDLLARLLDVASLRHRTVAQNVANVNSPGYRQLEVSFEDAFSRQLSRDELSSALKVKTQVIEGTGGTERADGNNVDIDLEMGRLNKNTVLYRAFSQILAARLALLRTAITGR